MSRWARCRALGTSSRCRERAGSRRRGGRRCPDLPIATAPGPQEDARTRDRSYCGAAARAASARRRPVLPGAAGLPAVALVDDARIDLAVAGVAHPGAAARRVGDRGAAGDGEQAGAQGGDRGPTGQAQFGHRGTWSALTWTSSIARWRAAAPARARTRSSTTALRCREPFLVLPDHGPGVGQQP